LTVLILISLGLGLSMPSPAFAHEEAPKEMVQVGQLNAGPYGLTVLANEYPIKAKKSLQLHIVPEGGIAGMKGSYRLTLPGSSRKEIKGGLNPYPGVKDAWAVDFAGIPAEGDWVLELSIQGPQGEGTGSLDHFKVLPPPGIPKSVGWIIGLFPLYLLLAFIFSEGRRLRRLKTMLAMSEAETPPERMS
jgi:hypothetical protein